MSLSLENSQSSSASTGKKAADPSKLKDELEHLAAELKQAKDRLEKPLPADTEAGLIKLGQDIFALEARYRIKERDHDAAVDAHSKEEAEARVAYRREWKKNLLATGAALKRDEDAGYLKAVMVIIAYLTKAKRYDDGTGEFNRSRSEGEERIPSFSELLGMITLRETDTVVEEEFDIIETVDRRYVFGGGAAPREQRVVGTRKEKRTIPGRQGIVPTPLYDAFSAPAIRPGEKAFRVEGTRHPDLCIDVNGAEYP